MTTTINLDKVKTLARDLRTGYPRSASEAIADYAVAARALDKCRAEIMGQQGEYHYDCPLSHFFLDWAEIDAAKFKDFVSTGADDAEVATWIKANAKPRERAEILAWSNEWREKRISQLDPGFQAFLEDYVAENCPAESRHLIKTFFDVYDVEEKRLGHHSK